MQRIVTGVDENGRSCVVAREEQAPIVGGPGIHVIDTVYDSGQAPPPARPPGSGDLLAQGLTPGATRWLILDFDAGATVPMHHTDTVDFDVVLDGSMDLVLDDGSHTLRAGDCAVVTGVDHGWVAGPEGCRLSVTLIGTPPLQ